MSAYVTKVTPFCKMRALVANDHSSRSAAILTLDRHQREDEDTLARAATLFMTGGGDERILLDPATGLNRYHTAPRPEDITAFSSSTANCISAAAFAEVKRRLADFAPNFALSADGYADGLDRVRGRLRATWKVASTTEIVFAASGTDLEYVGLAAAHRAGSVGIDNILLGVDEVGSGCTHSASGLHFAKITPLGIATEAGAPIHATARNSIRLIDVPLRSHAGWVIESEDILLDIAAAADAAIAANRHPLIHVVHGSKTGLVLPSLAHIDALRRRYRDKISFVVDACQARISRELVSAYLSRGCVVYLTGSKFMGGPPFSGFAMVPRGIVEKSAGLLAGFDRIFAAAEWPDTWRGQACLPQLANLGLLLRLEASLYELELYHKLAPAEIKRTLDLFDDAIEALTQRLGAARVQPFGYDNWDSAGAKPMELRTLVTLDLSQMGEGRDFDFARELYLSLGRRSANLSRLGLEPIRLGQPVKCIRLPDGRFGANVRIGLSMPQMVEYAAMDSRTLRQTMTDKMTRIGTRIEHFLRTKE